MKIRNGPDTHLWNRALAVLGHAKGESEGSVKKTLSFGEESASEVGTRPCGMRDADGTEYARQEERAETVLQAIRQCPVKDSPMCIWRLCGDSAVGKRVLGRCKHVLRCMPPFMQRLYLDAKDVGADATDESASLDELELITPTKKILMSANTGSEAARRNGTRAANNRERLRDSMIDLFSNTDNIKLKCNELLQLLDRENDRWFCENLLENFIRFSNKLSEHETSLIEKKGINEVSLHASDVNTIRLVCESLFKVDLTLHQQMLLVTAAKLDELKRETHDLFLVAIQVQSVSLFLSVVSFVGVCETTGALGHFNVGHDVFQALHKDLMRIENDIRLIVLTLIELESFLDTVPPYLPSLHFAQPAFDFCARQRKLTEHLRSFTELFVFSKCNNILSHFQGDYELSARDEDSYEEYKNLDADISHPIFVKRLFLLKVEPSISRSVSSPAQIAGTQETKYWFFKLHTDLLPIVNCVSKSVAKNAVLSSIKESDQILSEESNSFVDFEEKFFEICWVKCQHFVDSHCQTLIRSLAPSNTNDSVIERGTEYCADAALQLCYDALGEAVKNHLRNKSQQERKRQPKKVLLNNDAPAVLTSPFVRRTAPHQTQRAKTMASFAFRAGIAHANELLAQDADLACDDWTEFMLYLVTTLKRESLDAIEWSDPRHASLFKQAQSIYSIE